MLRLAPSRPPLWLTESSLQLGDDRPVRIDDVTEWQERLLDALHDGVPEGMVLPLARTLGATQAEAECFVARIGSALSPLPGVALPVRVELPSDIGFGEAEALLQGWRASALDPVSVTRWRDDRADPALPAIVVADRMVDPRRAAALMASDTVHLPIELAGDRVVVGPLVVPGTSGCLACRQAHRVDADPGWPLVAAQLLGRARTATDTGLLLEAAVLAGRLLRAASHPATTNPADRTHTAATGDTSLSVALSAADVRRVWHAHRPHARCLCRSPEGIGIAAAGAALRAPTLRSPTTTATAYERPA